MTYVTPNHLLPQSSLSATRARALLDAGRVAVLADWSAAQTSITTAGAPAGNGAAFSDPTEFVRQASASAAQLRRLHGGLEGLYAREPARFEQWFWTLVRSFGLSALRYEQLLALYDAWDPAYGIRFAAMAWGALGGVGGYLDPQWVAWRTQVQARWTAAWTPPSTIGDLGGIVMVPGRSAGAHWADSSALHPCQARADAALPSLRWILNQQLNPTQKLLVLCSGGTVRSPTAEGAIVRQRLEHGASSWPSALRGRLVFAEDGLSRHSGPNGRAAARLALLHGQSRLWVITEPFHYVHLRSQLAQQWDAYCVAGLHASDRDAVRLTFPVGFDAGTWVPLPPATRGAGLSLNGTALVPAPGNVLDT